MKFLYNDWEDRFPDFSATISPASRPIILPSPLVVSDNVVNKWCANARSVLNGFLKVPVMREAGGFTRPSQSPDCMTLDFAVTDNFELRLIEGSAFPNLNMLLFHLERQFNCEHLLEGKSTKERECDFIDAVCAGAEKTFMVDVTPFTQLSSHEFLASSVFAKVLALDEISIVNRGVVQGPEGIFTSSDRIYNRLIPFEVSGDNNKKISHLFSHHKNVYGHPYWRYALAKPAQRYINHICVPKSGPISDFDFVPSKYVIKTKYGYGGAGVIISPSRKDWEHGVAQDWIAQERVHYADLISHPVTGEQLKGELRCLFVNHPTKGWQLTNMGMKLSPDSHFSMSFKDKSACVPLAGFTVVSPASFVDNEMHSDMASSR